MSPETYELIALAMRYWFIALALLIVFRAWRVCVTDNRNQKLLRDWSPEAGAVGEFLVTEDSRTKLLGARYPIPSEGVLGSGRVADVRIARRGIAARHYYMTCRDNMLILTPMGSRVLSRGAVLRDGDSLELGELTLLVTFYNVDASAAKTEEEDEFEDIVW